MSAFTKPTVSEERGRSTIEILSSESWSFIGTHGAVVDEKLRLKIPAAVLPAIEQCLPWLITSLDGQTLRMYPAAERERIKGDLRSGRREVDGMISAAEMYESGGPDSQGRMVLPATFAEKLHGKSVWLTWENDHIQILSDEQYREMVGSIKARVPLA